MVDLVKVNFEEGFGDEVRPEEACFEASVTQMVAWLIGWRIPLEQKPLTQFPCLSFHEVRMIEESRLNAFIASKNLIK